MIFLRQWFVKIGKARMRPSFFQNKDNVYSRYRVKAFFKKSASFGIHRLMNTEIEMPGPFPGWF
ncbi:hypothetical protein B2D07_17930 [Desulfococcus multivorans]|nr:hypothetical protein B2D07_17930 [Desulfococcus multivorans]